MGTALLAYALGVRHAFDADHIVAIDNVTRKLMRDGKHPITVRLFFALRHSAVVAGLSVAIALSHAALQDQFDAFKTIGGVIGSLVSALFLFAIAVANIRVLIPVYRVVRIVSNGGCLVADDLELTLAQGGFLASIFRGPLSRTSNIPGTCTLSASCSASASIPRPRLDCSAYRRPRLRSARSILIFPALFVAGMTLVDTTDNIFMLRAYGWAFIKPIRKLYYNPTTTALSIIVATLVGCLQALHVIGDQLG